MNRHRGFTLLELLVTVTIVGILAAIAYPSYRNYVLRTNRSAAQRVMLDIASREEQYKLDARNYTCSITGAPGTGLNVSIPPEVSKYYTVNVTPNAGDTKICPSPGTYLITATATGSQTRDGAFLTLDNTGVKTPADKW